MIASASIALILSPAGSPGHSLEIVLHKLRLRARARLAVAKGDGREGAANVGDGGGRDEVLEKLDHGLCFKRR
ncbi:MAG: hypothetical protein U5J99_12845 [Parvularculaceae bacterium]|nr:hypothetical protein [Parvularculaceae bacterium]